MPQDDRDLIHELHRQEVEQLRQAPPCDLPAPQPIDLPEAAPGLLSEGARGKYALVKAGQPISVWDTLRDAVRAAELLYGPALALVQPIYPTLRPLSTRSYRACRA